MLNGKFSMNGKDDFSRGSSTLGRETIEIVTMAESAGAFNTMAEVISDDGDVKRQDSARRGRRPKFTPAEDLILVREVAAAKAHISVFGEKGGRYAKAAENANGNTALLSKVTGKSIQDRYIKLQAAFDKGDAKEFKMSGMGGEVGEIEELLAMMKEARDDLDKQQKAETDAKKERDEEKERLGNELVARALQRTGRTSSDGEDEEDAEAPSKAKRAKRNNKNTADPFSGEMERFAECLRDADLAKVEVERDRLELERERMKMDREERMKERELRREERVASNKLELEKFKLMLEVLKSK